MDAQERARECLQRFVPGTRDQEDHIAEHIRQAEQAAREKALENAARFIVGNWGTQPVAHEIADRLRALKEQK